MSTFVKSFMWDRHNVNDKIMLKTLTMRIFIYPPHEEEVANETKETENKDP